MTGIRIGIQVKTFSDLIRLSVFTSMIFDITSHIFHVVPEKIAYVRILFYSFPKPPMQVIFYTEKVEPKEAYIEYTFEGKEEWNWIPPGAIRDPSKKYIAIYSLAFAEDVSKARKENKIFNVPLCKTDFKEIAKFAAFSKDIIFVARMNNKWIYFTGIFASPFLLTGSRNSIAPFIYAEGPEPRAEGILAPFVKFDETKNKAEFLLGAGPKDYFAPLVYIANVPLKLKSE